MSAFSYTTTTLGQGHIMNKAFIILAITHLLMMHTFASVVLNFDNPPMQVSQEGYGSGDFYYEQGFRLGNESDPGHYGSFIRYAPSTTGNIPYNGTVHIGTTLYSNAYLESSTGSLFELTKIDLGEYSSSANWVSSVSLEGVYADGSTVEISFDIDRQFDGPGGIEDYETFVFPATWTGLQRVNFLTDAHSFDNIEVRAIPEPSVLVLGSIVSLSGFFIRRFFHA